MKSFNDNNHSIYKGKKISVEIYGASHTEKIGVKVKGFNKKDSFNVDMLQAFLDRRKPSSDIFSTSRKESDKVVFSKGSKNGVLNGRVFVAEIFNTNQNSKDYGDRVVLPRPAHADYVASVKYGEKFDHRGGGKFSGRMTAPMCIAGGIFKQLLLKKGITVNAYVKSVGNVSGKGYLDVDVENFDFSSAEKQFPLIDDNVKPQMIEEIQTAKSNGDSVGGVIECVIKGVPVGSGEFMFDSIESVISRLAFAIPAVKGIEFGLGFEFAKSFGSKVNDEFYYDNGIVKTKTNYNAGINGGIANGMPITFRVVIKPTPSISLEQNTVNLENKENAKLIIGGRHDSCIVPRVAVVVEAIASMAIYDIID